MMSNKEKQALTDLSVIINMMPVEMKDKISVKFVEFIEKNKDNNYISKIKPYIPLREQKLSEETEAFLAIIYKHFLKEEY